jgi:hypothetical protein
MRIEKKYQAETEIEEGGELMRQIWEDSVNLMMCLMKKGQGYLVLPILCWKKVPLFKSTILYKTSVSGQTVRDAVPL